MFTRLAKSGLAKFRLVQPRRSAPGLHETKFSNRPYCNDNLPGFRRPAVVASAGLQPRRSPVIGSIAAAGSNATGRSKPTTMRRSPRQQWTRRGVHMAHRFQRKQLATRVLALVLVTLLFSIAILAAIYKA